MPRKVKKILFTLSVFRLLDLCASEMEGRIVGGLDAKIEQFPHSAFMAISCQLGNVTDTQACGATILSQQFLLTAAHCLAHCDLHKTTIDVAVGSTTRDKMNARSVKYHCHPGFNEYAAHNDICVVKLQKPLKLGAKVKKVVIMKTPPEARSAVMAGWGLINEEKFRPAKKLQKVTQNILTKEKCKSVLKDGYIPVNTFCTTNLRGYAALGDSGSGLMIYDVVQVGIVSYKNEVTFKNVIVYTNVSSFYDWIYKTMKLLSC